jgi:ADP-heptose:LPS heptosyltransferase
LSLLKAWRADLRLAVVVEDRFRGIFEGNPDVDAILPPEAGELRKWRPRLTINFHGGTRSAWLTAASGADERAGFAHFRFPSLYHLRIPRAQEILCVDRTVHTAEHLASAMFWLGVPPTDIPRARLGVTGLGQQSVAVIHPVGATPEMTWKADGFVAVAEQLRSSGLEPLFIGAASDDLAPFKHFRTLQGAPLTEIASVLATAALFVGNDSGPAHMAAAAGLPVVVIFGSSNPAIWGPWHTVSEVVTAPGGIQNIHTSHVLEALARLRVHA